MPESILPPKSNTVFQLLFGDPRNIELLADFLKSVLDVPEDEYQDIVIVNPYLTREYPGRKLGIVDLRLTTLSGQTIHVEIQRFPDPEMRDRLIFYDANLIAGQVNEGEQYSLKRVISILITDYDLIPRRDNACLVSAYHHRFTLYDPRKAVEFTDILEIHTLELTKIPETPDVYLWNCMRFLRAETKEEIDMIANASPAIQKATATVKKLSKDERARMLHLDEVMARMCERARLDYAIKEGKLEIARAMFAEGDSIEKIARITGISQETLKTGLS